MLSGLGDWWTDLTNANQTGLVNFSDPNLSFNVDTGNNPWLPSYNPSYPAAGSQMSLVTGYQTPAASSVISSPTSSANGVLGLILIGTIFVLLANK